MAMKILSFSIPMKTVSESNSCEHWSKKNKRHTLQKWLVKKSFLDHKVELTLPVHVILIRVAPRKLDTAENLPCSFKWIYDAICDNLIPGLKPGRADSDERITVEFRQEKGAPKEYSVKIILEEK